MINQCARDLYLKSLSDTCLHARIEKDAKIILELKTALETLVYGVCNSRADTPPYLLQLAKDIKARHLNDDTTAES